MVALGSLAAAVALPVSLVYLPHQGGDALLVFTGALAVFVAWAHRSNIRRILKGEENRFGKKRRTGAGEGSSAGTGASGADEHGEGGES
jgi:hypothetical protein